MRNITDWRDLAACRNDPDAQFPTPGDNAAVARAKAVCAGCPLVARNECLREALARSEPDGVWGGLTVNERARLKAGMPARICAGCKRWFVPGKGGATRCHGCPTLASSGVVRQRSAEVLAEHRQQIAEWAAQGWRDPQIARELGCRAYAVLTARQEWGIPPGYLVWLEQRRAAGSGRSRLKVAA